ncbi:MAG TPA: PQQ-dependent sugar dehydrogenase [Chitinophagales bacterium]|nr:PQQ-dependent sugar dehydrogenase [Chitinophagales bacterium]
MKKTILFFGSLFLMLAAMAQVPSINMVTLATGYSSPVDIKNCGDNRLFIVEQAGYIRILNKNGTKQAAPFLNIDALVNSTGNEQGLLSLAFSPNYKEDGYFYVNYINGSGSGSTRISRFSVMANDSTRADSTSEQILLTFTHPYTNHKGATLMFGKDGYLYSTQGDGGSGGDPQGNGQNKNTYLGKILRIDVSNPGAYTIPADNPFVGQPNVKEEIWAYGVRNPWRCSFDRITGDMWIGDVGQDAYEEIDFQSANSAGGENYGWRCREGLHAYNSSGCAGLTFVDPIFETPQTGTICSVTGGYVYRGAQYSKLFGLYLHSDFCNGRIWSTRNLGNNTFDTDSPAVAVNGTTGFLTNNIGTFGEDNLGELYIAGRANGRIYRLTETSNCNPVAFISLQDTITGCSPVKVSALQGDTLSYEWYNSNGVINGATAYQYAAAQSGWYKVRVSKTQNAACQSMSDSVYVQLTDTTAITTGTGVTTFCKNSSPVVLNNYLQPAGGTYSGTAVSNNTFNPALSNGASTNVIYTYTNQFECVSHGSLTLQVNDTTVLTKNSLDSVFCSNSPAISLTGFYNLTGSYSGSGVANDDSTFNPASAGAGIANISFLHQNQDGCQSTANFNLLVQDLTTLTKNVTDSTYCTDDAAFSLAGFISPAGGSFSGTGVSGNNFTPAAATFGSNTVYYEYTNVNNCTSRDSFTITVAECLGIENVSNGVSFSIFPNPNKGNFNLSVNIATAGQTELVITDAVGKICYTKNMNLPGGKSVIPVEISQLAKGMYTIQLKGHFGKEVKSLVIE